MSFPVEIYVYIGLQCSISARYIGIGNERSAKNFIKCKSQTSTIFQLLLFFIFVTRQRLRVKSENVHFFLENSYMFFIERYQLLFIHDRLYFTNLATFSAAAVRFFIA